jgi:hypothetical protein
MSAEDLPRGVAAARAKSAVMNIPSDPADLWKVKMLPKEGYISLVSLGLGCCLFYVLSSSLVLIPVTFTGADPCRVHFLASASRDPRGELPTRGGGEEEEEGCSEGEGQ